MYGLSLASPINWSSQLNRGLLRWWLHVPMVGQGSTWRELNRRSDMTISGALARGPTGRPGGWGCRQFNGTSNYGQTDAIDLSGISTMAVSFWLYWDVFGTDNDLCVESSATIATTTNVGAIAFFPNISTGTFLFRIRVSTGSGSAGYNEYSIVRPTAAAWHHYVVCLDRNGGAQQVTAVYVDGASQSLTLVSAVTDSSGGFGNYVWNFMARNGGTSLQGAGRLDDFRIYNRVLPAWEARALFHASRRGYPQELRWSRGAEFATEAPAAAGTTFNYYQRRRRNA